MPQAGPHENERVWDGDLDSVAGRRLKRHYRNDATDDAFLERVTLLATLVFEGLQANALRPFLQKFGPELHRSFNNPPQTLGTRNLLQRMALVVTIEHSFRPQRLEMASLVKRAEGADASGDAEVLRELHSLHAAVHDEFSVLAYLYDLRNFAGIAHTPNPNRVGDTVQQMGLPRERWRRADFLRLMDIVTGCVQNVVRRIRAGV